MSKALYRKYRPLHLKDVVGQTQVTKPLIKSLEQGKISHAYLFIGPRGTGKTSVARIFAHEINNFKYEVEDSYVDIIEIDGASNRGIDNIRELREKAMVVPTSGKYKVYIIDEVHMLTKEAFNALLKTLEEPPKHVIFIMATTDAYKVPVTITSRAQTYTFKLADSKIMIDFLRKVADQEKIKISGEALDIIVRRGGGSFRDSLSLLDQISTLSDKEITKDIVVSAMGLPEDEKITELLANYDSSDIHEIVKLLKELLSSGVKPETLAEEMIARIIADPKPELLPLLAKLPEVKAPFAEAKLLIALSSNITHQNSILNKSHKSVSRESHEASKAHDDEAKQTKPREVYPSANFDWEKFAERVQSLNDAVYVQLKKTSHELINGTLHIYPEKKIIKTILSKDNNKKILDEAAGGVKIEIHNEDEKPTSYVKDEMLTKISDIMGGEVKNDGGENPFEG